MIWARHRTQPCQLVFDDVTGRFRALSNTGAVIASSERTRDRGPLRFDGVSIHTGVATFDLDITRTSVEQARAFVAIANGAAPAVAPPAMVVVPSAAGTSPPSTPPSGSNVLLAVRAQERARHLAHLAAQVVVALAFLLGIAGVAIGIVAAAQEDPACDRSYECDTLQRYPLLVSGIGLAAGAVVQSTALLMAATYVQWRIADRSVAF